MSSRVTNKDRLILAAQRLLTDGGELLPSAREIGRRAGVDDNAFYRSFKNPAELWEAAADDAWSQVYRYMAQCAFDDPIGSRFPLDDLVEEVRRIWNAPEELQLPMAAALGDWRARNGILGVTPSSSFAAQQFEQRMLVLCQRVSGIGETPCEPERIMHGVLTYCFAFFGDRKSHGAPNIADQVGHYVAGLIGAEWPGSNQLAGEVGGPGLERPLQ